MQLEMDRIIDPLIQQQESELSMEQFLELLAKIKSSLNCHNFGFLLLDEPNNDLSQLHQHKASYWIIDEDGISQERKTLLSDFYPTKNLFDKTVKNSPYKRKKQNKRTKLKAVFLQS
ncbi:MAG: hypothetical protein ACI92G_000807 [Candidatus Pelagisphaera sp.]|jgi:hypothetical protein